MLKYKTIYFLLFFACAMGPALLAQQSDITQKNAKKNRQTAKSTEQNQSTLSDETTEKKYKVKPPKKESKKGGNVKAGIPVDAQATKSDEVQKGAQTIKNTSKKKKKKRKQKAKQQNVPVGGHPPVYQVGPNDDVSGAYESHVERSTKEGRALKSDELNAGSRNLPIKYPPSPNDNLTGAYQSDPKVDKNARYAEQSVLHGTSGQDNAKYPQGPNPAITNHSQTHANGPSKQDLKQTSKALNTAPLMGSAFPPAPNDAVSYDQGTERMPNQKLTYQMKSQEVNQSGDLILTSPYHTKGPRKEAKEAGKIAINIPVVRPAEKSHEQAISQGDIYIDQIIKPDTKGQNEYRGEIDYAVLAATREKRKSNAREISSNVGDIAGVYQRMKQTEKEKAIQAREYRGLLNYDVLKERDDARKRLTTEISKNTGDIVANYVEIRNKIKESGKKMGNYSGKIDYSILKQQKDKMVALDREIRSYSGDITGVSLEQKRNNMRNRSRKHSSYQGEFIVTARSKSNHPSAVHLSVRDSKSLAEKEKIRKQQLRKAKRHRDREDPSYMKKKQDRPKYDDREWMIWESRTREGEVDFSNDVK